MENGKPRVLTVATPLPARGGGGLRALRSLEEYVKHFDTNLVLPWDPWIERELLKSSVADLRRLESLGVKIVGYSRVPWPLPALGRLTGLGLVNVATQLAPRLVRVERAKAGWKAVVALHENWDTVHTGGLIARETGAPSMVLLQLPPFYGSRERLLNIVRALLLWRELGKTSEPDAILEKTEVVGRLVSLNPVRKRRFAEALEKYKLIVGVTRATAVEMGGEWEGRMVCLNPGVALDSEDLQLINRVKAKARGRGDYIVFGGRPVADKGLPEALIVFKALSKHYSGLKLVVTGWMRPRVKWRVGLMVRRLGLEGRVLFTGFIPREERFRVVAAARLMLYPSHVDAFPYAVLESLHLGTPVVAYGIPAIEIHFKDTPGVSVVDEWDLEAMAAVASNILEGRFEPPQPPKLKTWEEIMREEVSLIYRLLKE
uniref:Glycosyltransferase n=1 Tax=Thermogladius calderae TaxID=1200300 RepID=A0A7J3Y012_9CREN